MAAAPRIFEKVHNRVVTMAEDEGGPKPKIFNWAVGVGPRGLPAAAGRARSPARLLARQARRRRQARLLQAARPASAAGCASSSPAAPPLSPRRRRVLPRRRHPDPRGLRPDRDQRRHLRQPARRTTGSAPSACRSRAPRSGSPTTARSCCAGPASCTATTACPSRPPRRSTPTAGCTPATSASSTRRLPAHHRPQEGPDQDLGRQVRRAAGASRAVQGALPAAPARSSCTATAATSSPRSSPSTRTR